MVRPAQVFISYAHADEAHLERLKVHLAPLRREGLAASFHDRQILPGTDWEATIDTQLAKADIVLLLVSADFVASDYCQRELAAALERHESGKARVIPVIVAPVDFGKTPFARFQALPRNAMPVSTWSNPEEAWKDVVAGIRQVIESGSSLDQPQAKSGLGDLKRVFLAGMVVFAIALIVGAVLMVSPRANPVELPVEPLSVDPLPADPLPAVPMEAKVQEAKSKPSRPRRAQQDAGPQERQSLSYRAGTPDEFKSLVATALADSRLEPDRLPCPVELRVISSSVNLDVFGRCLCPQGATTEKRVAVVRSQGGLMPGNIGAEVVRGLKNQDWTACP